MDFSEYFRIVSVADHVLHVENSGFWSDKVAAMAGKAFLSEFRKAAQKASHEGPFIVLADLRRLQVLSREGKKALSGVMDYARKHGMYRAVEVVPNAITRLSIREAAMLTGEPDFRIVTNSLDEATALVETLKEEMLADSPAKASAG